MDVRICGTIIGQCSDRDGWEYTDQWIDFRSAPGDVPPSCATLETETEQGVWTAYDSENNVIANGRITVQLTTS